MTTLFVIFALVCVVLFAVGVLFVRRMLRLRRNMLDAYRTGMAEGAAQPGAADAPRGAGGLTAAQTTAMANRMLQGVRSPFGERMGSIITGTSMPATPQNETGHQE